MTNQDLELWHKLQQVGLVNGEMPPTQIVNNPWYLRVLQGLTGWFAAWFLLGSVFAVFHDFMRQESVALVIGVLFIVGAYLVYKLKVAFALYLIPLYKVAVYPEAYACGIFIHLKVYIAAF